MDNEYSWDLDPNDRMIITIKRNGKLLFSIGVHEVIESSSRKEIMKHIEECDRTPWLKTWQEELMETCVSKLKGI